METLDKLKAILIVVHTCLAGDACKPKQCLRFDERYILIQNYQLVTIDSNKKVPIIV